MVAGLARALLCLMQLTCCLCTMPGTACCALHVHVSQAQLVWDPLLLRPLSTELWGSTIYSHSASVKLRKELHLSAACSRGSAHGAARAHSGVRILALRWSSVLCSPAMA